jgi:FKBP-type peptidyl-prolyl cis-trans isomerase
MNLGWEKGLLDMCVGEKRQLVVPSGKAYGQTKAHGSEGGTRVMPGATVVYHVELLDILSEEEAAAPLVWGL